MRVACLSPGGASERARYSREESSEAVTADLTGPHSSPIFILFIRRELEHRRFILSGFPGDAAAAARSDDEGDRSPANIIERGGSREYM